MLDRPVTILAAAANRLAGPRLRITVAAIIAAAAGPAVAQLQLDEPPEEAQGIDVIEHLGDTLPRMLRFTNEDGEQVVLDQYLGNDKPVILALVYYDCPVICPVMMGKFAECVKDMDFTVGEDFTALMVSFDPSESATHAASKGMQFRHGYEKADAATTKAGWPFLTGEQDQITALTEAVGFKHKRLPNGEYSHPPVLVVLSPEGKIVRYIYGLEYDPGKVEMSLLEASEGRIAKSLGQRLAFLCYAYDPEAGAYTMEAMAVMRIAGGLTVVAVAVGIGLLMAGERARRSIRARRDPRAHTHQPAGFQSGEALTA